MITQNQVKVLKLIIDYIGNNGISPTSNDIGNVVNLKSSSNISGHIESLEKLGCISRTSSDSDSITVTEDGRRLVKLFE